MKEQVNKDLHCRKRNRTGIIETLVIITNA
jgi:hypothetical protein